MQEPKCRVQFGIRYRDGDAEHCYIEDICHKPASCTCQLLHLSYPAQRATQLNVNCIARRPKRCYLAPGSGHQAEKIDELSDDWLKWCASHSSDGVHQIYSDGSLTPLPTLLAESFHKDPKRGRGYGGIAIVDHRIKSVTAIYVTGGEEIGSKSAYTMEYAMAAMAGQVSLRRGGTTHALFLTSLLSARAGDVPRIKSASSHPEDICKHPSKRWEN